MRNRIIRTFLTAAIGSGVLGAGGCASRTGSGAVIGGLGGAAIGAAIGSADGNAGKGALIGGAVGALGGAVVGNTMDRADNKREQARRDDQRRYEQQPYDEQRDEPAPRRPATATKSQAVSVDHVIEWWNDGDSEEEILERLDRSRTVFRLTARDEDRLRDEGVSEDVIRQMKRSSRQAAVE